jgi:membrane-bound lytic murein transglycosylase A
MQVKEAETFFFEKKKQKTLARAPLVYHAILGARARIQTDKSFLVLFFKKEHSFLLAFFALAGCTQPAALKLPLPPAPSLQPAVFADLPGWREDALAEALPALLLQCQRLALLPPDTDLGGAGLAVVYAGRAAQWSDACAAARALPPGTDPHGFFESWFAPYRITTTALVTGYFEPVIPGARQRGGRFETPVLSRPLDLRESPERDAQGRPILGRVVDGLLYPYYTRAEIEAGAVASVTTPIAWVESPVDLFFAQIQGAMLIQLAEGGTLRLVFDGRNGRPYTPIGRILKQHGDVPANQISLQTIRAWLDTHPAAQKSVMDQNESYVFFRVAPDPDPALGPPGALGVTLTAGRSAAIDKTAIPLAAPLFVSTTIPDGRTWRHLVLAQDLGSAIEGPARIDLFFGAGAPAAAWAGPMHQDGTVWVLLPRPPAKVTSGPIDQRRLSQNGAAPG